jgi:hypothetical protein
MLDDDLGAHDEQQASDKAEQRAEKSEFFPDEMNVISRDKKAVAQNHSGDDDTKSPAFFHEITSCARTWL